MVEELLKHVLEDLVKGTIASSLELSKSSGKTSQEIISHHRRHTLKY